MPFIQVVGGGISEAVMNDQKQENRIRLVLLDELALFRASLSRFLTSEAGFEVAGECGTSAEALEILSGSSVDVVLLDLDVGAEHGDDFMFAARQAGYQGRFLIVTAALDARKSARALKLGASGIFLKSEALNRLVQAIHLVANGDVWIDQKIVLLLAEQFFYPYSRLEENESSAPLEDRERNVLQGIVGGLTNRKIGDNLGLSESSVKNIVQRLFGKAGVKTRGQLVRVALQGSLGDAQEFSKRRAEEAVMVGRPKLQESRQLTANVLMVGQSEE